MNRLLSSLAVATCTLLVVAGCGSDSNPSGSDPSVHQFPERYVVNPAWVDEGENTLEVPEVVMSLARSAMGQSDSTRHLQIVYAESDGEYNYYTILLGHIDNVPITAEDFITYYAGTSTWELNSVNATIEAETATHSTTLAITETIFESATKQRTYNVSAGFSLFGLKVGGGAKIQNSITNSTTSTRSSIDTWTSASTYATSASSGRTVKVGDRNEPTGRYRLALFATTDVYLSVRLSLDNETVSAYEFTVCARPSSYTWALDYDPNLSGANDFAPRQNPSEFFPFPEDFTALLPPPEEINPMVSRFVAVSSSGRVEYSDDGITWDRADINIATQWNDVTFADGMFVAVGDVGSMAYSRNGIDWTRSTINPSNIKPADADWNGIAFGVVNGNNTWVVVGSNSQTTTSSGADVGVWEWTNTVQAPVGSHNGIRRPLNDIVYANGRFVVAANGGQIAHSLSGDSFTNVNLGGDDNNGIAYGNSKFVVVGNNSRIRQSPNGTAGWTQSQERSSNAWLGVAYGDDKFVVVGSAVSGVGKMLYSADGTSWTPIDVGDATWRDVAYGQVDGTGRWVAVGADGTGNNAIGRMAYSNDGISWTQITVGTTGTDTWRAVTFGTFYE